MNLKYDYLIVGAGLFGCVCAYELSKMGNHILIIDKRNHIGGNCYTKKINNIQVHMYGPHIFHTNNKKIWDYINQFAKFNNFINRPKVIYKNKLYSFPINLMTLYQIFNIKTPTEAISKINNIKLNISNPKNFEEWILSKIGTKLYNIFIKGYTIKQWNTQPNNLPTSIIKRIPIRFNFNDNYYNDSYQGVPIGGYTQIFEKMTSNCDIILKSNYFDEKKYYDSIANKIIYTGMIDEFFNYKYGYLQYRALNFEIKKLLMNDFQGNAIINYTDINIPYTRIIEHKYFENMQSKNTIITREYPINFNRDDTYSQPCYPINNKKNNKIFNKYKQLAKKQSKIIFGGRLANYKYYDMHQIISNALNIIKNEK